jgi:DNA-binding CsgD family transcriptional regulator
MRIREMEILQELRDMLHPDEIASQRFIDVSRVRCA